MCLDELEAKQRERVWTSSLERRRSAVKRLSQFSWAFVFLWPIIWFLFPHLSYPGTLSWVLTHPSAKMALKVKASERSKAHYGLELYLHFWPTRSLSACVSPKWGEQRSLNPWLKQDFAPLCPCMTITLIIAMTITLRCLQETNTGYLPCLCCYFHLWEQTGGWL